MPLTAYTAHVDRNDPDLLDVSLSRRIAFPDTPGAPFSPFRQLELDRVNRRVAGRDETDSEWLEYVRRYTAQMRESYRQLRPAWDALLARERVVLACTCRETSRCHRVVLARDILGKLGARFGGELV